MVTFIIHLSWQTSAIRPTSQPPINGRMIKAIFKKNYIYLFERNSSVLRVIYKNICSNKADWSMNLVFGRNSHAWMRYVQVK